MAPAQEQQQQPPAQEQQLQPQPQEEQLEPSQQVLQCPANYLGIYVYLKINIALIT